jgi:hypothetical protein
MITKNNIQEEYPRISQNVLPEALQQKEFDDMMADIDLYDDDDDIRKYVDTFIEKLNEVLEKQSAKAKPEEPKQLKQPKATQKPKKEKPAKSPKSPKPPKPKREPKPQKEPKPKPPKAKTGEEVTELPIEVQFIKSYVGWNGKVKTKTQVYNFIKRLQKAIAEKRIRKTSKYALPVKCMQASLIEFYNKMRSGTKTYEIPAPGLARFKEACNMHWADHVVIIRQFINILNETKTDTKTKAQTLLKKINSLQPEFFEKEIKLAILCMQESLENYLAGKTDAPEIQNFDLQGLYGLAGLSGFSGLGNLPQNDNKILSASDFKNASFNLMGFSGKWLQLVGNPSVPFKMMIWGTGGSGKSTLANSKPQRHIIFFNCIYVNDL